MLYGFKLSLLILVLMEYKNTFSVRQIFRCVRVLILVLMEYKNTMVQQHQLVRNVSLNPCSNGIQKYLAEGSGFGGRETS